MSHKKSPIALITGASSGLGEAFAYELARQGYQLILVARRIDRLNAIAKKITTPCQIYSVDLSQRSDVDALCQQLPKTIDLLICNAGYRLPSEFDVANMTDVNEQVFAMINGHNALIHHFLPGFMTQKHGRIINVSSIAGLLIYPNPLYGPIKAYQHHQAINLHQHYSHFGIHCMSLCPGLVKTEFHTVHGPTDWSHISQAWWMNADTVVKQTLKQLAKKKTFFIPGWYNRLMYVLARHFPIQWQQAISKKLFSKH